MMLIELIFSIVALVVGVSLFFTMIGLVPLLLFGVMGLVFVCVFPFSLRCLFALFGAMVGAACRGQGLLGALLGFFLGPIGLLLVFLLPDRRPIVPHPRCPYCDR